jgi:restriction system protein
MGFLKRLLSPQSKFDPTSNEALQDMHQNSLDAYREKAGELANLHIKTLSKKRKRLVTQDDYGVPCADRWFKEIESFCDRVLRADPDFLALEADVMNVQFLLGSRGIFPEKPKDELLKFIDELVDIEMGSSEEPASEYSKEISPEDYEHFCAEILNKAGWVAVVTKGSGDQGIDIIADKEDFRLAIQCKKYAKPVGNKAVQEAYSGGAFYEADECAVVAPIEYTPAAKDLANSLGVHLFHHDDLADLSVVTKNS